MPSWTVFLFYFISLAACLFVVGVGLWQGISNRPSATPEYVDIQVPHWGLKVVAKTSAWVLLVLIGLAGAVYITIEYPKAWIAIAIVLGAGGAGTQQKRRRDPRKPRLPSRRPKPPRYT
jgi:hypothetical protein